LLHNVYQYINQFLKQRTLYATSRTTK